MIWLLPGSVSEIRSKKKSHFATVIYVIVITRNPRSDQTSRSNYQFTRNTKDTETCMLKFTIEIQSAKFRMWGIYRTNYIVLQQ